MRIHITFHIPAGKYQFIFGYGGGVHEEKSLARRIAVARPMPWLAPLTIATEFDI